MSMLSNRALSQEIQAKFQTKGWAQDAGYLDPTILAALLAEIEGITRDVGAVHECQYFLDRFPDGQTRLARVEAVSDALTVPQTSGLLEKMAQDARVLLGGEVVLFKDKLNIRYPGSPGYAPHQDAARWHKFGKSFVSFGLFLSASDVTRGGFQFAQYDLTQGVQASQTGDFAASVFAGLPRQDIQANAGDALIIDGRSPHCTTANQSSDRILHLLFTFVRGTDSGLRKSYYTIQGTAFEKVRQGNLFVFAAR